MPRRPFRPRVEALENRTTPARVAPAAVKLPGDFSQPHTTTEIMARVHGDDPVGLLTRLAATNARTAALIDPATSRAIFTLDGSSLVQVGLSQGADPGAAATWLATYSQVLWVEPNAVFEGDPKDFTANDPQVGSQYHVAKMQLPTAWDTTTGNSSIIIAITDNGTAINHPDLVENIWVNADEIAGNGIDDDTNGFIDDTRGWDFNANDNDANPVGADNHGTHTAGIAAARTNNATGVAGVAGGNGTAGSGARIMPLRWEGANGWTAAMVAGSFTYAADHGAKIVSSSYNFDGFATNSTVLAAFDYTYTRGLLHFNSAGNNNQLDPARRVIEHCIFVSSTDANDVKSSFTNYGVFADIAAPGSSVLATTASNNGTTYTYGSLSGTSMSTPNAAGVAALIWSANPTWTREQVVAQLLGTADSIDAINPAFAGLLGTGRANAARALTETLAAPRLGAVTGLPAAGATITTPLTTLSIIAPMRFDPTTVLANSFELRGDGADGIFNSADDIIVPLTPTGGPYRVGTNTIGLTAGAMPLDRYRFIAKSASLRNPFGTALDGDANGTAGGDFVREFTYTKQVNGLAYEDWDANGVRDAHDPAVAGTTVYHDANANGTLDGTPATTVTSTNVPLAIPDLTATTSSLTAAGFLGTLTDVNVSLTIGHLNDAHLDVFLIAPDGTRVELFTDVGGTGDNFTGTTLDDQAATLVSAGVAPFTGTYRPEGSLATLNGRNPNGLWRLEITDDTTGTTGTLTAWSVRLTSAETSTVSDAFGTFGFSGLTAGTYTFRHVAPAGMAVAGPSAQTIAVPANPATVSFDVGQLRTAPAVYGRVYVDTNANGTLDAGEVGQGNRLVYVDANGDGSVTGGEAQTLTDANGNYRIPITGSSVPVRLDYLAGQGATSPPANLWNVNVGSGPVNGWNFGQRADATAPTATVVVGDGTQRSRVTQVAVTFSEVVTFQDNNPLAAFALTRVGGGPVALAGSPIILNGQTVVTLVFADTIEFGSLTDGRYSLTIDATRVRDIARNTLQPAAATNFHRLFGDIDGDASVSGTDFGTFRTAFGTSLGDPAYVESLDFNADGSVSGGDFGEFRTRFGTTLP